MEEIIIKSEPKDERENYDNIMSVDIKVEEEDPFLQENTSEIEIDNLPNSDIKVEVFPFLQDNDSLEGMDGVLKENDINVEDLAETEGKEKRKTSDIKGQPKVKLAKTKHKLDFNEKKVINREQPNGERESEFSCNESDIEVGEDSDDSDYIPSEVKKQAKRERKKKKHRRSPDSKKNKSVKGNEDSLSSRNEDSKKLLQSSISTENKSSSHLLLEVCLICKKKIKRRRDPHRGVYVHEDLAVAKTLTGGKLEEAAKLKNDEKMLKDISGYDMVTINARYHNSCYRTYTNIVTNQKWKAKITIEREKLGWVKKFSHGYAHFCQTIIEEKIIHNHEIMHLTKLNELFKQCVQEKEGFYPEGYSTSSLKKKLKISHPNLTFLRTTPRTSEAVFVKDLSAAEAL